MIAPRYLAPVSLLLGLALVPTLIHSYSGSLARDGRAAAALSVQLAGFSSMPTQRGARWAKRRFNSDDWVERTYRRGEASVRLTVVRSDDPKSLYHHPELAITDGTSFSGERLIALPARSDVPVHVLRPAPGVDASAAYVLHYNERFVEDPIAFQVRTAGELLVSPRQLMTIFFVFEGRRSPDGGISANAGDLLLAAIDDFLGQVPNPAVLAP